MPTAMVASAPLRSQAQNPTSQSEFGKPSNSTRVKSESLKDDLDHNVVGGHDSGPELAMILVVQLREGPQNRGSVS